MGTLKKLLNSFIKFTKNFINNNDKDFIIIELDTKIFGNIKRNEDKCLLYPMLSISSTYYDDLWELYYVNKEEDKYGDFITKFTHIGFYDCRKTNIGKIKVHKDYKEFIEKIIDQFKE